MPQSLSDWERNRADYRQADEDLIRLQRSTAGLDVQRRVETRWADDEDDQDARLERARRLQLKKPATPKEIRAFLIEAEKLHEKAGADVETAAKAFEAAKELLRRTDSRTARKAWQTAWLDVAACADGFERSVEDLKDAAKRLRTALGWVESVRGQE